MKNALYINVYIYIYIIYELYVMSSLHVTIYGPLSIWGAFSKKKHVVKKRLRQKQLSAKQTLEAAVDQVFCCSLFIEKPRVADAISSIASILAISLASLSQKLELAVSDIVFFHLKKNKVNCCFFWFSVFQTVMLFFIFLQKTKVSVARSSVVGLHFRMFSFHELLSSVGFNALSFSSSGMRWCRLQRCWSHSELYSRTWFFWTWSPLSLPDKKSRSKMLWPCLIHFWSTIYLSTLSAAYWDFPKFSISFIPFFNGIYGWDHGTSRCGITIAASWKRQRQASKLFIWRSFAWWNIIPSIFHVSKKRKPRSFPCKRPWFFWWWIHSYLHSYFGGWGKHGKVHMEKPSLGISAWCQSTCVKVATFIQALHQGCHHQNLNRPCLSIIFARFFVMEKLQLMICLWRSFQEKSLQS